MIDRFTESLWVSHDKGNLLSSTQTRDDDTPVNQCNGSLVCNRVANAKFGSLHRSSRQSFSSPGTGTPSPGGARNCHTMKISDGDPVWRSWVWVKLRCFGGGSRILEGLGSSGCGHLIYAYTV